MIYTNGKLVFLGKIN